MERFNIQKRFRYHVGIACVLTAVASAMFSCKPDNLRQGATKQYFDLKGYFNVTAFQLKNQQKHINKTVLHNGRSETKTVEIANWNTELALFNESDINKPAWAESYAKKDSAGAVIYTATDADLKTRRLVISKTKTGAVAHIAIYNEVNNLLYNTRETLNYYPNSAYTIEKYQKVTLLGANTYKITGKFN